MGKESFPGIGLWGLVSDEYRYDDGTVSYPIGRDGVGQIMYDAKGNIAAQIGDMRRPVFKSPDLLCGTPAEVKAAFEGYIAYFGTYTVDEKKGIVIHHVKSSLFPNWIGSEQVRYYRFEKNRLILSTPPMPIGGKSIVARLIWERIS
jgi:hypothetical protein